MRLTTDTPKNNLEMALNLFYVKDKEVWVRGYGKNGADISLFDLSRDLTRWNCPYEHKTVHRHASRLGLGCGFARLPGADDHDRWAKGILRC